MPKFYGAIDLVKNELQNAVIQNLGSAPSSPTKGQMYFNSSDNTLYWYSGSAWIPAMDIGGGGAPTGPAGGDLSGAYPNPGVAKASGTMFRVEGAAGNGGGVVWAPGGVETGRIYAQDATRLNLTALMQFLAPGGIAATFGNSRLTNVGDPFASSDAATKNYVDNAINGLSWKDPVRVATTANIPAMTGLLTIDGVVLVDGNRVLVKNQTAVTDNGIYVAHTGAWTRATDADTGTEIEGMAVWVNEGSTLADTAWVCTANPPITVPGTNLPFVQFGAGATYTAGAGLTQSGNTFDVGAGGGILVYADMVSVDTTVVAMKSELTTVVRKYSVALAGTASPEVVTHNLSTRDVHVQVYNGASPFTAVQVDWDATTVDTVTIRHNPLLGAGYRAVVFG